MKKQIINISTFQTAKVVAALYLVSSLPIVLLLAMLPWNGPGGTMPWGVLVAMPICYALVGFLCAAIGAWLYNLVAARVGGIEFATAEIASD